MNFVVSFLIFLAFFACSCSSKRCRNSKLFYSQKNFILKGHTLESAFGVTSVDSCKEKCRSNSKCHSINFYREKGICEVNKENHITSPESIVPSSDGGEYVAYEERAPSTCSKHLCSYPHPCIADKANGGMYTCCQQGQMVLNFPRKSKQDYIVAEGLITKTLTELTVSAWLKVDSGSGDVNYFSYATNGSKWYNQIMIELVEDKTLNIALDDNEDTHSQTESLYDGKWHHYVLTWKASTQKYYMYVDGVVKVTHNTGINGIPGGGVVVVGQDQDSYKGGFSTAQAFIGSMSRINLWDKYMTSAEITALYSRPCADEGNLIKWSDLYTRPLLGQVNLSCLISCK